MSFEKPTKPASFPSLTPEAGELVRSIRKESDRAHGSLEEVPGEELAEKPIIITHGWRAAYEPPASRESAPMHDPSQALEALERVVNEYAKTLPKEPKEL